MYRKNVAGQFVCFQLVKTADGTNGTGITVAVRRCIDGTFAAGGGTVTEDLLGLYKYAMSQADTNGNNISFQFTGTGVISVVINIVTTAADPTTATNFGITALPATAVTTNASLLTSGTGTDQLSVSAGKVLLQSTQSGVTIPTVTTVTNQLTAAQIATGIWQDAVSGDFTVASSIGKSLYTSGNVPGAASGIAIVGSAMTLAASQHVIVDSGTVTTVTNQLTAAQIATGVWQDATAGDFTVASSIGKSLYTGNNVPGAANGLLIAGSNATTTFANFVVTTSTSLTDLSVSGITQLVGAVTATNASNDIRGVRLSATGIDDFWDEAMVELSAVPGVTGTFRAAVSWLFLLSHNKLTQTSSTQTLRNNADGANIGTATVSDDNTTAIRGKWS